MDAIKQFELCESSLPALSNALENDGIVKLHHCYSEELLTELLEASQTVLKKVVERYTWSDKRQSKELDGSEQVAGATFCTSHNSFRFDISPAGEREHFLRVC